VHKQKERKDRTKNGKFDQETKVGCLVVIPLTHSIPFRVHDGTTTIIIIIIMMYPSL
jgi:hypothetical protein